MRKVKNFINTYFNQNLDLQAQAYNLLAFVGITAGIGIAVLAATLKNNIVIVLIDFSVAVLSYILLRVAEKKKNYHFCSWIFVIVVFFVFFPLLFFACGGYKSGAAYTFIIAFAFTPILLEKYERIAAIVLEFIIYVTCLLIDFYRPETASALPSDSDYLFFVILNLTITCVLIFIVLSIRTHIFYNHQDQIRELNRELAVRNETLAQYDSMKSDFLATVAHEISTPLAIISAGGSDTLDLLEETPLNMDDIIENIMESERMVKLIDGILLDLMDTVAIEKGRISLNRQPVNFSEFLANICNVQQKNLDVNGSEIIYDLPSGLPQIWLDPSRIEQVMINLLSNAFQHTKNGIITVKLTRADNRQLVRVIDNGEGMDPEVAKNILKQYISTKVDYWRHGIGLYICQRIIAAHGGEIRIESEKGVGTTICFSLREGLEYV